jgi:hypothetical protein
LFQPDWQNRGLFEVKIPLRKSKGRKREPANGQPKEPANGQLSGTGQKKITRQPDSRGNHRRINEPSEKILSQ